MALSLVRLMGITFFSLTKFKVEIDIEFNIYLEFDIHLK